MYISVFIEVGEGGAERAIGVKRHNREKLIFL